MGRVVSAFRVLGYGAVPLGAILGGAVARTLGLRAPFLLGAVVLVVAALVALPAVNNRTVAATRATDLALGEGSGPGPGNSTRERGR